MALVDSQNKRNKMQIDRSKDDRFFCDEYVSFLLFEKCRIENIRLFIIKQKVVFI